MTVKGLYTLHRVPEFLSCRLNWVSRPRPPHASMSPPPLVGETHSLEGEVVGDPIQTTGQKLILVHLMITGHLLLKNNNKPQNTNNFSIKFQHQTRKLPN
jgi:hypothetical protein